MIGQGTWYAANDSRSAAIKTLLRGTSLGMAHIDTAATYGAGKAEVMVAQAIEGKGDEVFLVSNALPENASRRGTMKACKWSSNMQSISSQFLPQLEISRQGVFAEGVARSGSTKRVAWAVGEGGAGCPVRARSLEESVKRTASIPLVTLFWSSPSTP